MIDEKKLIEDILQHENVLASANHVYKSGYRDRQYEIIDTIKRQPKVGEWIPVSERLPEEYESVLFSTHFGGVKFGYITSYREWKDEAEGYTHCDDEVTAWMELPESYKGESK